MKKIKVELSSNPYNIYIGHSILPDLLTYIKERKLSRNTLVIVDENVKNYHFNYIRAALLSDNKTMFYFLKPGERSKSYQELNKIYSFLLGNQFGRDTLVIVIGGGVAGDVGAFAASTFMRGVELIHIPTTLLSAVDSSVGGKTGINFQKKKNMVGTFYQPALVLIDTAFLKTLPQKEITSGIGEVIKYAYLSDQNLFTYIKNNLNGLRDLDAKVLDEIIYQSVLIKAGVVAQDEKETGLRKILNLGHTFAHAYESSLNFKIKHGEAVIAGLISALVLSYKMGLIEKEIYIKLLSLPQEIKVSRKLATIDPAEAYALMLSDKKNRDGKIKFVLLSDIGRLLIGVEAGKKDMFFALNKTKELLFIQ